MIIRVREDQTNKHDTLIAERDGSFLLSTHQRLPSRGKAPGYSDVPAVRARYVAGIDSDLGHTEATETQANSIRVPPGSRTIKCTLGPLPDRSGANSITVPGHAATRACNASSAMRSTTFNARWCKPMLRRRSNGTHFSGSSTCQSVTMPFPSDTKDAG